VDSITGALKKLAGSFCYLLAAVNRAGVTARGFVWLTVSREIPKAPKPVRKMRARSSNSEPTEVGLLFATEPNRRCLHFKIVMGTGEPAQADPWAVCDALNWRETGGHFHGLGILFVAEQGK